jgi:hypothetical protein
VKKLLVGALLFGAGVIYGSTAERARRFEIMENDIPFFDKMMMDVLGTLNEQSVIYRTLDNTEYIVSAKRKRY